MTISRNLFTVVALGAALTHPTAAQTASELVNYRITPSSTDTSIHRFDNPHYVVFEKATTSAAPLLIFMPGTGGRPEKASDFADVAAHQGYRVIGLEYIDEPAVSQICPRNPDSKCSEKVRQKRIYGDDVTDIIDDKPAESIVSRLTHLLQTLQRDHPAEGWGDYLEAGKPKWSRIAVSGLSQGAGMAAYIAQKTLVYRVVLFSSPWDNYGPQQTLASWVRDGNGATPPDRWFAALHRKENTAPLIARAYLALRIPSAQMRALDLEPAVKNGPNPYHPSSVGNGVTPRDANGLPLYLDDWKFLVGKP